MVEHFGQAQRHLLSLPRKPVGLLITGDCAYNSGQAGDYAVLQEQLLPIRAGDIPVHIALGNHDNRETFWEAFAEDKVAAHPVPGRQVAVLESPRANWFILDSLEKTASTPGLLGHEQLQWLADALDARPKKPALVALHHNPGLEGGNMGLKDTLLLLEVLRPRKQVKAYIYGHTHTWKLEQDPSGIHLVNLPALAYVFRETDSPGWVLLNLKRNGMRLECLPLSAKPEAQAITADLKWRA